jgi:hypothetical protein
LGHPALSFLLVPLIILSHFDAAAAQKPQRAPGRVVVTIDHTTVVLPISISKITFAVSEDGPDTLRTVHLGDGLYVDSITSNDVSQPIRSFGDTGRVAITSSALRRVLVAANAEFLQKVAPRFKPEDTLLTNPLTHEVHIVHDASKSFLLKVSPTLDTDSLCAVLRSLQGVERAEPDVITRTHIYPSKR